MNKPLLSLSSQNWLTGIAPYAHAEKGGLFFKADGVTPLYEAGVSQSTLNGLLMAGASGTVVGGSLNGNILCSAVNPKGGASRAYFGTSSGHIFYWAIDSGDTPPTGASLTDAHTAAAAVGGLATLQPVGGTSKLYYWQNTTIGDYDYTTFADSGTFTSGGATINLQYSRPVHKYFDSVLYGNGQGAIGELQDDGASGVKNNTNALPNGIPATTLASAIADDGVYAVIAITANVAADPGVFGDTRVLFWDGFSNSWNKEFPIPDPFITKLIKTPVGVFAFGITGIWQCSFTKGITKVFSRTPGLYVLGGVSTLIYGTAASYFNNAVIWGGTSGSVNVLKSLGELDITAPNANLHPFLLTAGKNITFVNGQILKGWILVGDDTPQLVAYPVSQTNVPQTGVSAQTVYLPLPYETQITRIELVFGQPLAAGDAFNIQTKLSESDSAVTFDSCSYTNDGAIRRKVLTATLNPTPRANAQISFILNWTGGAVKIKSIHVFGEYEIGKTE